MLEGYNESQGRIGPKSCLPQMMQKPSILFLSQCSVLRRGKILHKMVCTPPQDWNMNLVDLDVDSWSYPPNNIIQSCFWQLIL